MYLHKSTGAEILLKIAKAYTIMFLETAGQRQECTLSEIKFCGDFELSNMINIKR